MLGITWRNSTERRRLLRFTRPASTGKHQVREPAELRRLVEADRTFVVRLCLRADLVCYFLR